MNSAQMFVRHDNPALTEEQVRALAADMIAEFGAGWFWVDRAGERLFIPGLTPPPRHHALWIVPSLQQLLDLRRHKYYAGPSKKQRRQLGVVDGASPVWMAPDGTPIVGAASDQFIGVALMTRYYGVDWGSGDWPFFSALMEWLESRIPGAAIWYGGDWGDTGIRLTTPADRARMEAHYLKTDEDPQSAPHRVDRGLRLGARTDRLCGFCAGRPMRKLLLGTEGVKEFWCDGCEGREAVDSKTGKTFLAPVRTDHSRPFDIANRRFRSLDDDDAPWKAERRG